MEIPEPETFEELHRAMEPSVFRYILGRVKDTERAEDLTVEVFVQAYRVWDRYQANPPVPPREWIMKAATILCDQFPPRNSS